MRNVLTFLPTIRLRQRIVGACDAHDAVHHVDTWKDVTARCDAATPDLLILDPTVFANDFTPMAALRRRHPTMAFVAYIEPTPHAPNAMTRLAFTCGKLGASAFLTFDFSDSKPELHHVLRSLERAGMQRALDPLASSLPAHILDVLRFAVSRAATGISADDLATAAALSRRGLAKALERHNLPAPNRIVTWGRLVAAASMLEQPDRSADSVARALRFPSGSAFRNTCQRYLQCTPHALAGLGGAAWVAQQLPAIMERAAETDDRVAQARVKSQVAQTRSAVAHAENPSNGRRALTRRPRPHADAREPTFATP